ncbi:filamentous hemagglutinin-like protein [Nostoc carneum NIES-2107]|nr:filamentous hemagglutinin-like protein [Nostoc carneum NIES-2107]
MQAMFTSIGLVNRLLTRSAIVLPLGIIFLGNNFAHAQVTSDGTTNTIVNQSSQDFTILNGIEKGNNLFHSFSNFSVPNGGSATFDLTNTPNITNIFSRVTGGNVSDINGLIQTLNSNNAVSLFLMNPHGIIFGQNASLNISGSFVGTTASSIKFADGTEFSAVNTSNPPLLTMNVPIGLQMGSNTGTINLQGSGRATVLSGFSVVSGLTGKNGLQVLPGKTLALVGGNVALDGGVVVAPGGRIELGSVMDGAVTLTSNSQGFSLSYPNATSFGNVQMTQRSLASVQGLSSGSVQLQGKQVSLRDGSIVAVQNLGTQETGDIKVTATEALNILGMSSDFKSSSGLINETLGKGSGGNIVLTTPNLIIDQGGYVVTRNFTNAPGGSITVNADDILVGGVLPGSKTALPISAVLVAATYGSGQGGNLLLNTQNLTVVGGGYVGTRVFNTGSGGNVFIKADAVRVSSFGTGDDPSLVSLISSNSLGVGNAGNLYLDTRTLSNQDGGVVSVSTLNRGNAGSLYINASESIDISGIKNSSNPSYIGAVARIYDVIPVPDSQANAGQITINTPTLNIRNSGTVFVANQVLGNAGKLTIQADRLTLSNQGSISASTKAGEGGNINLQLRDVLLMRHGSLINAEAGSNGNGGNININSPNVIGLENSDIIANAVQGKGGNIQITTQGIMGLEYRNLLNPREILSNDISASSQFSVSGTVQINNVGVDPNSALVELPENVSDASQQIASGCSNTNSSSFVAIGRGGIPQNPMQEVRSDRTWSDTRDISAYRKIGEGITHTPKLPTALIAATSWHRNAQGKIELVAHQSPTSVQPSLTCAALPNI